MHHTKLLFSLPIESSEETSEAAKKPPKKRASRSPGVTAPAPSTSKGRKSARTKENHEHVPLLEAPKESTSLRSARARKRKLSEGKLTMTFFRVLVENLRLCMPSPTIDGSLLIYKVPKSIRFFLKVGGAIDTHGIFVNDGSCFRYRF